MPREQTSILDYWWSRSFTDFLAQLWTVLSVTFWAKFVCDFGDSRHTGGFHALKMALWAATQSSCCYRNFETEKAVIFIYTSRKEEHAALETSIRNWTLQLFLPPPPLFFSFLIFFYFFNFYFGCFVWLFFSTGAARGFTCQVYKNIEERMYKIIFINLWMIYYLIFLLYNSTACTYLLP